MLFCCGALWAVTAATPLCGQIRIVPRAKLDSLAHPATADGAKRALRAHADRRRAYRRGRRSPVYTFRWRNTGGKPLVVTRVQTPAAAPRRLGQKARRTGRRAP
ncbi:MAG: hypothetical protein ACLRMJ_02760 [Alistipes finegoldii]